MRTLQTELIEKGISKKNSKIKEKSIKNNAQLSRRQIVDLMGKYMPKYKRNRGVFRQY